MVLSGEVPTMASGSDDHADESGEKLPITTIEAGDGSDDVELITADSLVTSGAKRKLGADMTFNDDNSDNNKKIAVLTTNTVAVAGGKRKLDDDDDDVILIDEDPGNRKKTRLE
uniref:Uncharacterized protein n=1 Tax=Picea sitchensis TaxID=3332 RepID=D5ACF3_PICSI|nr:unknown [Picea sitchensis]